jgi:hypothetical protein
MRPQELLNKRHGLPTNGENYENIQKATAVFVSLTVTNVAATWCLESVGYRPKAGGQPLVNILRKTRP